MSVKFILSFFNSLLLFLSIFLLAGSFLLDSYFFGLTAEQIVFHIRYYQFEILGSESWQYSWHAKLFVAFAMLVILFIVYRYRKEFLFGMGLFVLATGIWEYKYQFSGYLFDRFSPSGFYEENYMNPASVSYRFPENKKNVIVIFWESMEKTYENQDIYGLDLLNAMKPFRNYEMGHYRQIFGSNWTVAGMVTSLCSVPLRVGMSENLYGRKSFLPNLYCLPQIMEREGYQNIWLSTSDASFAFMDKFLVSHGFVSENILDVKYFENKYGRNFRKHIFGGDDIFMYAELKKLVVDFDETQIPFFIVANTIDTHTGLELPAYCHKKFGDFRDQVVCSSGQMADFLAWFEKQNAAENTVLLIIGDHLSMDPSVEFFAKRHEREIFNLLHAPKVFSFDKNRKFSALDIMPTLLDALGVSWEKGRLGLGRSLYDKGEKTLIERYGLEELNRQLMRYNRVYDSFVSN